MSQCDIFVKFLMTILLQCHAAYVAGIMCHFYKQVNLTSDMLFMIHVTITLYTINVMGGMKYIQRLKIESIQIVIEVFFFFFS